MNDTRIKVEYVHDEKESDHGAFSIRDTTPLQSKKKKPAPQIPSFAAFTENGGRHNTQTCSLGDGPLSKWRTIRGEQREESVCWVIARTYVWIWMRRERRNCTVVTLQTSAERLASNVSSRKRNLP